MKQLKQMNRMKQQKAEPGFAERKQCCFPPDAASRAWGRTFAAQYASASKQHSSEYALSLTYSLFAAIAAVPRSWLRASYSSNAQCAQHSP